MYKYCYGFPENHILLNQTKVSRTVKNSTSHWSWQKLHWHAPYSSLNPPHLNNLLKSGHLTCIRLFSSEIRLRLLSSFRLFSSHQRWTLFQHQFSILLWILWNYPENMLSKEKMTDFRGDLTNVSAEKASLLISRVFAKVPLNNSGRESDVCKPMGVLVTLSVVWAHRFSGGIHFEALISSSRTFKDPSKSSNGSSSRCFGKTVFPSSRCRSVMRFNLSSIDSVAFRLAARTSVNAELKVA